MRSLKVEHFFACKTDEIAHTSSSPAASLFSIRSASAQRAHRRAGGRAGTERPRNPLRTSGAPSAPKRGRRARRQGRQQVWGETAAIHTSVRMGPPPSPLTTTKSRQRLKRYRLLEVSSSERAHDFYWRLRGRALMQTTGSRCALPLVGAGGPRRRASSFQSVVNATGRLSEREACVLLTVA